MKQRQHSTNPHLYPLSTDTTHKKNQRDMIIQERNSSIFALILCDGINHFLQPNGCNERNYIQDKAAPILLSIRRLLTVAGRGQSHFFISKSCDK